jgi:hypothetical protein
MDHSKTKIDLSLLVLDWARRAVERELLLGTQLDPKFPSADPAFRPSALALGGGAAFVCLADHGVVAVPFDGSR